MLILAAFLCTLATEFILIFMTEIRMNCCFMSKIFHYQKTNVGAAGRILGREFLKYAPHCVYDVVGVNLEMLVQEFRVEG